MKQSGKLRIGLLCAAICCVQAAFAQKSLDSCITSNGLQLAVGDSVTLGVGSSPDGHYRYIFAQTLVAALSPAMIEYAQANYPLYPGAEGMTVPIRKIKKAEGKVYLFVMLDDENAYIIALEAAIAGCEVAYCRPEGYLTQQEFEKLILMREAYNDGTLSEERWQQLRADFMESGPVPEHLE